MEAQPSPLREETIDVAVVGAGAAGLMAAISAAERGARVALLNNHRRIGLKILMSGGSRCNVTHTRVGPDSFNGGSRNAIGLALKAFPAEATQAWFEAIGVRLKEEPGGKIFPVTDSARTVLEAMVRRARELGVGIQAGVPVTELRPSAEGFAMATPAGRIQARAVILCTGGLSYPRTGSDGSGHDLARTLGHSITPLTPALTPLSLAGRLHVDLKGVTTPAALTLWSGDRPLVTRAGSLLFTHFGLSGPAALDLSRHWLARGRDPARRVTAHFLPGPARPLAEGGGLTDPERAERPGGLPGVSEMEGEWLDAAAAAPATTVQGHLGARLPSSLVREMAGLATVERTRPLGQVARQDRRRLLGFLAACSLEVTGTLGYQKAEATAGGIPLEEVDPRRMASRRCPGLYLAGEILDVDGRIGGYNFQWAWSSGRVAGQAAAARAKG